MVLLRSEQCLSLRFSRLHLPRMQVTVPVAKRSGTIVPEAERSGMPGESAELIHGRTTSSTVRN